MKIYHTVVFTAKTDDEETTICVREDGEPILEATEAGATKWLKWWRTNEEYAGKAKQYKLAVVTFP